jgi:peptide/nickel transport system substrate-binding protein
VDVRDGQPTVTSRSMRLSRRSFLLGACAVSGASLGGPLLAACSTTSDSASAASLAAMRGGTLRLGRNLQPHDLNPLGQGDNGSIFARLQIYDQLVEIAPGTSTPVPGLAESWTISPDGLTYTFKLRSARFSDGSPVTAEDVKFSLDRFANQQLNTNYGFLSTAMKQTTILDPRTVQVTLKTVDASFLNNLGVFVASIVPQKTVEAESFNAFSQNPIGSGPFMLKKWINGQVVELVKNPYYWNSKQPYLDGANLLYVPDDDTRILEIESNGLDVAESIPFAQIQQVRGMSGIQVLIEPLAAIYSVWLNNAIKPLNEQAVRQALNYATPSSAIVRTVFFGHAQVANSILPVTQYWDPAIPPYPYDLSRAEAALAESSTPKGFAMTLVLGGGDTVQTQTAEILKNTWGQIGVRVTLQQVDPSEQNSTLTSENYEAILLPANSVTSDVPVPDEMASIELDDKAGFSCFFTNFKSTQTSDLVEQASGTLNPTTRQELFSQLQKVAMQQAPTVPIAFVPNVLAVRTDVHGFATTVAGNWPLKNVWLG